jgi:hypothetical protein
MKTGKSSQDLSHDLLGIPACTIDLRHVIRAGRIVQLEFAAEDLVTFDSCSGRLQVSIWRYRVTSDAGDLGIAAASSDPSTFTDACLSEDDDSITIKRFNTLRHD